MKKLLTVSLFTISHLLTQAQEPELVLPIGHHNSFGNVYISPKGNLIATTGFKEKMIAVWDVKSGKLLATFNDTLVYSYFDTVFFSSDGKKLYTAGGSRMIWDIEKKKLILDMYNEEYLTHRGIRNAFNQQGTTFASSRDSLLSVIDLTTNKVLTALKTGGEPITSLQFSPDGDCLAYKTNKELIVLNTTDYSSRFRTESKADFWFTPDSKKLLLYRRGSIHFIDVMTGRLLDTIASPLPGSITIDAGSKKMLVTVTAGRQTKLFLLDIEKGSILHSWENVLTGKFYPGSESVIVIRGAESKVEVWNPATGKIVRTWNAPSEFIISDDGSRLATVDLTTINVFNSTTGTLLREWPWVGHLPWSSASLMVKGKKMINLTTHVNIWDIEAGRILNAGFIGSDPDDYDENINLECDQAGKNAFVIKAGRWQVWNIQEARLLIKSAGIFDGTLKGAISKNGELAAFLYQTPQRAYLELYDVKQLKRINRFTTTISSVERIAFSPDNLKLIISYTEKEQTEIRLRSNYSLVKTVKGIFGGKFSFDGKKMITTGVENSYSFIWDIHTGAQLMYLEGLANFNPVMNKLITSSGKILDLDKKEAVAELKDFDGFYETALSYTHGSYSDVYYSSDGKKIIGSLVSIGSGGEFPSVYVWDVFTGKLLQEPDTIYGYNDYVSSSGKKILHVAADMKIVDVEKNDTVLLVGSRDAKGAGHVDFSDDDRYLFTSAGQTTKKWEVATGRLLFTFFPVDSTGYLNRIPSGYYSCSPDAARSLHYVKGMQVINFEQSDICYNRPDKVLENINYPDTLLIDAYRKAYNKRIKKLGIDTSFFQAGFTVPEADFRNRNEIEDEQNTERLNLHITGFDSVYKLSRFNIWINEVPLFGSKGISLLSRSTNYFDTTVIISLTQGENSIETSVTSSSGMESYKSPLLVKYIPARETTKAEKIHFIGIGINTFSNADYNLDWSVKDIRDLARNFKKKYGNGCRIDTLFNEKVTTANIKALKESLYITGINDKVIIAYSGHGMLCKDFDYYLSTYSVNFDKPEENGLPYDEMENLLDSIPARKKLMLIDACHSGEVDKEDLVILNTSSGSLIKGLKPVGYKQEVHLGLKNSFELMQSLFVNVGKSTGATIISAAAGTQFALERNDLKNGVFTFSILEAMNKYPTLKISELKKIVGERVEQLTNGLQKPTSRNETIAIDWNVW